MKIISRVLGVALMLSATLTQAGQQLYEPMSASVRGALSKAVSDTPVSSASVLNDAAGQAWLAEMSRRLTRRIPDEAQRMDFLKTAYYEATRAGLDPELVLGLIEVESGFKKYAVSSVAARGYMQVMPFWTQVTAAPEHDLFHLRTNLRYGCNILRLYVNIERGDLYRALGRYNGSLGKPEYPNMVLAAWKKHWTYVPSVAQQSGSVRVAGN